MRATVISIKMNEASKYSVVVCGSYAFEPGYFVVAGDAKVSSRKRHRVADTPTEEARDSASSVKPEIIFCWCFAIGGYGVGTD